MGISCVQATALSEFFPEPWVVPYHRFIWPLCFVTVCWKLNVTTLGSSDLLLVLSYIKIFQLFPEFERKKRHARTHARAHTHTHTHTQTTW